MLPVNCSQCLQSLHLTGATVFKFLSTRIPVTVGHVSKTVHPYCTKSIYKSFICNRGGVGSYISDQRFRPQRTDTPSRRLLYRKLSTYLNFHFITPADNHTTTDITYCSLDYCLKASRFDPRQGKIIFSAQNRPDWHWGIHRNTGTGRAEREVDHSPLSNTEFENEWSHTSTPPRCLHGAHRSSV